MRRRRLLLLTGLSLPLAGCLPAPYGSYYRPSTADPRARALRGWCGGQAGPLSVLEIDLDSGLRLRARAERDYVERERPDLPLRLDLQLPAAPPSRFVAAALTLRETAGGKTIEAPLAVRVVRSISLAAGAEVDASALRPGGAAALANDAAAPQGTARWQFRAAADFAPASFALQLPTVHIGAQRFDTPAVVLSRPGSAARPGDYRSAAEQQHLRDREAACRRDTPKLACENIVPYSERSFAISAGPLHWSGRWSRFESSARAEPLTGSLSLAVTDPRPWRLADPAVTLSDPTSGRREQLQPGSFDIRFDDRIALDTPLQPAPAAQRASTTLYLEASLPPGLAGFEVQLPPLLLGERRIDMPPIRFERRSFDGGVAPFNC